MMFLYQSYTLQTAALLLGHYFPFKHTVHSFIKHFCPQTEETKAWMNLFSLSKYSCRVLLEEKLHTMMFFCFCSVSTAKISKISWTTININVACLTHSVRLCHVTSEQGKAICAWWSSNVFKCCKSYSSPSCCLRWMDNWGWRPYRLTVIYKITN